MDMQQRTDPVATYDPETHLIPLVLEEWCYAGRPKQELGRQEGRWISFSAGRVDQFSSTTRREGPIPRSVRAAALRFPSASTSVAGERRRNTRARKAPINAYTNRIIRSPANQKSLKSRCHSESRPWNYRRRQVVESHERCTHFCMHATCCGLLTSGWLLSFGSPNDARPRRLVTPKQRADPPLNSPATEA
jgi:hypothetical protein